MKLKYLTLEQAVDYCKKRKNNCYYCQLNLEGYCLMSYLKIGELVEEYENTEIDLTL